MVSKTCSNKKSKIARWLFLILLTSTLLGANGFDNEELSSIYTEAFIFISVFAVMSIISIIISKKHAKQYAQKSSASRAKEKERAQANPVKNRLLELSKLVNTGLLTEEEFQTLKQAKESTQKTLSKSSTPK